MEVRASVVMRREEILQIRERVRSASEHIQPLLAPAPGHARRNAPAHLWLGVRVIFGEEWRVRADSASVLRFIAWIEANPNADYDAWDEKPEFRDGTFSERLF